MKWPSRPCPSPRSGRRPLPPGALALQPLKAGRRSQSRPDARNKAAARLVARAASEAAPNAAPDRNRPTTLSGCLAELADLPRAQKRLLPEACTAVSTLARVTGKTADTLPAEPERLRPIISAVLPAAHCLSLKRWATPSQPIRTLLLESGWIAPESRPRSRPRCHLAPPGARRRRPRGISARPAGTVRTLLRISGPRPD